MRSTVSGRSLETIAADSVVRGLATALLLHALYPCELLLLLQPPQVIDPEGTFMASPHHVQVVHALQQPQCAH